MCYTSSFVVQTDLLLNLDNFLLDSGISCVGNLKRHITGTFFSMVLRFGLSASIVLSDEDNQLSEVLTSHFC